MLYDGDGAGEGGLVRLTIGNVLALVNASTLINTFTYILYCFM